MEAHNNRPGTAMGTVTVAIPTFNEERSIGTVIDNVPVADLLKLGLQTVVYVIDGQSTDNTREIAIEKGAQIILEERKGKGAAIQTAFKTITADYVIMVDGDDTYPIEMATEMAHLLVTNDVVIGSRLDGTIEKGAMTKLNVVGNTILSLLAWMLFDTHISDMCTGFWAYRNEALQRLELSACGFEIEADMFIECVRNGLRIAEIPITYRARKDQPKLSSVRDGVKIGLFLCKRRFRQTRWSGSRARAK
jgi:glycosyltransferase involved in cell wall biosynthesis